MYYRSEERILLIPLEANRLSFVCSVLQKPFRDFLGNLVRTLTGTTGCAAVVSLPQSKPEMSDWDLRWQDIVVKEVNRVAKNLISNDEAEISEVVRRRLFEDLGNERMQKNMAW